MRIVVTGGAGQLACAIARRPAGHEVLALSRDALDVRDVSTRDALAELLPDVIVNAAAVTSVDGCERDPESAYAVNAIGARNVALGAAAANAALVQVSTDYVFDGEKGSPYWEFDRPNPINVYGASKLAGEELARRVWSRVYVVRSAWLYGLGGRSFVSQILGLAAERPRLEVVDNQIGSPTFCDDLADAILGLVATGAYGTYHLAGEGQCSRFVFARAILELAGKADYPLAPTHHFPRDAKPPAYAPLRNFAAAQLGIRLPDWRAGLAEFFARGGVGPP